MITDAWRIGWRHDEKVVYCIGLGLGRDIRATVDLERYGYAGGIPDDRRIAEYIIRPAADGFSQHTCRLPAEQKPCVAWHAVHVGGGRHKTSDRPKFSL